MKRIILLYLVALSLNACQESHNTPEIFDPVKIGKLKREPVIFQLDSNRTVTINALIDSSYAIIEGDIRMPITKDLKFEDDRKLLGFGHLQKKWTKATVYYMINASAPNPNDIKAAIREWSATGIKFIEVQGPVANYIEFIWGPGASSAIGMVGGRQEITLPIGVIKGVIMHEIGHALGLWHEHSRPNATDPADPYIEIVYRNIHPQYHDEYSAKTGETYSDYDYSSIMHYSQWGGVFAIDNRKPVIIPKKNGAENMGQRQYLSDADKASIKERYGL